MEQLKIERRAAEGRRINHWARCPVGICALISYEMEGEGGWRDRKKEWLRVSSQTHLWPWRGWCGAPSPAGSWPCSGNLLHLIQTRSQCEGSCWSARRICVLMGGRRSLWTRRFQGWAWIQREREREREGRDKEWRWHSSRWALEQEVMADSFTYSPSAIHSISSTCPLNTILELEGPDGMRKVGFLSSAGSSTVTHTHTHTHTHRFTEKTITLSSV